MAAIHKDLVSNILTSILVLCAVIVTTIVVRQYLSSRERPASISRHFDGWKQLVANRKANIGSDDANLKIVEFSDYQCPYCRALELNLQALVRQHQGKIAVIRYDFPLRDVHAYAFKAAVASRCAAQQGIYEPFEDELFKTDLATAKWNYLAHQARVTDISKFSTCLNTNDTASLVDDDIKAADAAGITATPTLIINGNVVYGMQTESALDKLVSGRE